MREFIANSCLPTKVYMLVTAFNFIFTFIIFGGTKYPLANLVGAIFGVMIVAIISMLCNYLCSKGWTVLSWLICIIAILTLLENIVNLNAPKKRTKKSKEDK